jgi:hypothetical protein
VDDLVLMFHSTSIGMITQWSYYVKPEVDRLLDVARYDLGPKRAEALKKTQEIVARTFPWSPSETPWRYSGTKRPWGRREFHQAPLVLRPAQRLPGAGAVQEATEPQRSLPSSLPHPGTRMGGGMPGFPRK